jgi:RHS repeat-associated protein
MNNPRALLSTTLLRALFGALITLVLVTTNGITVAAQIATPLASSPGVPQGSYPVSNIDTVNYFNGRVNINIPLWSQAGRGALNSQLAFSLDSPAAWSVEHSYDAYGGSIYFAHQNSSGWIGAGGYTIRVEKVGTPTQNHQCWVGYTEEYWAWNTTLTRVYLVGPDGTQHEMRDVLTNGQPLDATSYCPLSSPYAGPSRGKVFRSVDGSGATIIFDSVIRDSIRADDPSINYEAWVLFKDGRRFRVNEATLRDRNGNLMSWPNVADPWTDQLSMDSLNRKLLGSYSDTPQQCATIFGAGVTTCGHYEYKGFDGAIRKIWLAYDSALEHSAIQLPNGLSYRFYYNQYGDLTRLELPGGGSLEYEYEPGLSGPNEPCGSVPQNCIPGTYGWGVNSYHVYRRVTERRVYREGHVLESKQTYSKPEDVYRNNLGYVEKKDYDGSGNLLGSEKHYFYGSADSSFMVEDVNYPAWKSGREYRTEVFDASGTMLRATDTTWEQRASVSWWTGSSDDAPQNDPRVKEIVSHLENGQSTRTTYAYEPDIPYNSLIGVSNYDFNGSLLRRTQTTYLKDLNGIDYTGSDIQTVASPHLRDFPLQVSIYDGGGTERARTVLEYDVYTANANHAVLTNRPDISGFDSSYGASYTTRANVTAATEYLLTNGVVTGSVVSYAQYDIAGNVVKAIDQRGYATHFDYRDNFGVSDGVLRTNDQPTNIPPAELDGKFSYAFPFKITNALGHAVYSQFDYSLGRTIDAEDPNGTVSSAYFSDPLERQTQFITAVNRPSEKNQATISYDDVTRTVTTESDQTTYNDKVLKNQTVYDGLGRTVETRVYESDTQYISIVRVPFLTLPVGGNWVVASRTSNPFRPGEQPVWTTRFTDTLSRVTKLETPDNAIITSAFNGNRVLVTDQAGNKRISRSDGLGRLTDIWEVTEEDQWTESISFPNDPATKGYRTTYTYDTLDNLVMVSQGGQTRTFVYDSLKRLLSANNPESGTICYGTVTNNQCQADGYDENGNLRFRTDARGVLTDFRYDALNRLTTKLYRINNQPDPQTGDVEHLYDNAPNGKGRPWTTLTHGSSPFQTTVGGYDGAGRVTQIYRMFGNGQGGWHPAYGIGASYNLAGAITAMTYPSSHSVSYNYDRAGRLADNDGQAAFGGNLGDGEARTYATAVSYTSLGGMQEEKFGTVTPIYHKQRFNDRGQLWDIRASTVSFATDPTSGDRGAIVNYYSNSFIQGGSGADNNGNLLRQEIYIPGSSFFQDNFTYDALNRLTSFGEKLNGTGTDSFSQSFYYDRWGNRTITSATGTGINNKQFALDPNTNRLGVPSGQSGTMGYDSAGNLTSDSYSGSAVMRSYDAENKMTSETTYNTVVAGSYKYDGDGNRVKRIVTNNETWQIYGIGGELLAEYAPATAPSSPEKEYGYRNGELLITATAATDGWGAPPVLNDNPLQIGVTTVQARHITELRVAINALRGHLSIAPYPWQYSATTSDYINANPIIEMRTALDQALGAPPNGYSPGLAQNQLIKAVHIQELRDRVLTSWQDGGGPEVRWLVSDHLGTPRLVFDQTGALANMSRHDYLPFGEEVPTNFRTGMADYSGSDNVRQRFTGYERDTETALDFAQARYHSSVQGRFTSVDPLMASADGFEPQSWNRYTYVINNPLTLIDPSGLAYHVGGGTLDSFIREFSQDPKDPPLTEPIPGDEAFNTPGSRVIVNVAEDAKTGRKLTDAEVADRHIQNMLGVSLAGDFESRQSGQIPLSGSLNPLYHPQSYRPPAVYKPPTGPELIRTLPPTPEPGWKVKPHVGPDGVRVGPDQDLKYFREEGSSRSGPRAGVRLMELLGKGILIVSPASRISPVIVCGICLHVATRDHRSNTLEPQ